MKRTGSLDRPGARDRRLFDKDILKVGQWRVGDRDWPVDLWTLRRLVINFQRARDRGVRVPVVWNHSGDARDKIGEVVRLYLSGETLPARFWATGKGDAERIEESASQVSVEVVEDWVDGKGRQYDLFLSHLAIVTHPVVHPQEPVYRLSMRVSNQSQQGVNPMSEEQVPVDTDIAEEPVMEMEALVASVVELVNQIVDALGASLRLEDGSTAENLVERLQSLRDQAEALAATSDSDDATSPPKRLSIEDHRREETFNRELDRLIGEGRLLPSERDGLVDAARPSCFSLALLKPFARLAARSAAPMDSRSRRHASRGPRPDASVLPREKVTEIVKGFRPTS